MLSLSAEGFKRVFYIAIPQAVPLSDRAILIRGSDAQIPRRLASDLGIDVPETWCSDDREQVRQNSQQVSYPLFF